MKPSIQAKVEIVNKRAAHNFFLTQHFEAGIMLRGTEIKSIRMGFVNLNDAYCFIQNSEVYVKNLYIKEYDNGTYYNHDARRERKLLLNRNEIKKLERKVKEKGFTIIPYRLFISDRGLAKLEIALAQGKKAFDKRETIKEKDNKRDMERSHVIR
ncbi:MAG: SsrA-binding protein SmpB [Saprospiraceae bacterium]|jgi:SsrA-binding protein|nr:SsrA-binding protein SmpB [Saprospiraceae bacterium]MBL0294173.1 SsrA-binding protein SmpB [Saprospiraceae bacterium]